VAVRADDVLDGPAVAGRERARGETGLAAEPLTLVASVVQQDRNFPQDSLRSRPLSFPL